MTATTNEEDLINLLWVDGNSEEEIADIMGLGIDEVHQHLEGGNKDDRR